MSRIKKEELLTEDVGSTEELSNEELASEEKIIKVADVPTTSIYIDKLAGKILAANTILRSENIAVNGVKCYKLYMSDATTAIVSDQDIIDYKIQ